MPIRKISREERKTPFLNFQQNMRIPFSISEQQKIADEFILVCNNKNVQPVAVLREFFFEILNVKDESEFQKMMTEPRRHTKDFLMRRITRLNNSYNFSELMSKKIRGYIDNEKSD